MILLFDQNLSHRLIAAMQDLFSAFNTSLVSDRLISWLALGEIRVN